MKQLRELLALIQKSAPKAIADFTARHPYRTPKGYPRWDMVAAIASASPSLASSRDAASRLMAAFWQIWDKLLMPVYCLDGSLLDQFGLTDVDALPKLLPQNFRPADEMMLVLPPTGKLRSPNDGEYIALFFVAYHFLGGLLPINAEHPTQISVSAIDSGGCIWVSGTGVEPGHLVKARNELGADPTDEREHEFLAQLTAIATQCLLARSFLPELVDLPGESDRPKVKHSARDSFSLRSPRWIGKGFVKHERKNSLGGSHSSPRTHWRRGHWRSQPYGPGLQQHKPVWIRPTLVNLEESP